MTTVARGPKAAGGTNFSPNTTILNDEVDTDFNTLFADYNGSITNTNLSAAADIAETKIADHGTIATQTSPGFDGTSPPTDLAGEIERLRYALATVKTGNATNQTAAVPWYDRSLNLLANPRNMLRNGSFECFGLTSGAQSTTAAPQGWTAVGAATFVNQISPGADANGRGFQVAITGVGASNTGLSQTLAADSLRPSTTYLCFAMAKAGASDIARMFTSGATTDLDAETASTTMKLLTGFFTTTAGPAQVVFNIVAKAAGDVATFDHVFIAPMVSTSRESGYVAVFQQMETAPGAITNTDAMAALGATVSGADDGADWTDATVTLQRSVICPGPGYMIKVSARLGFTASVANTAKRFRLLESIDGGANWVLRDGLADESTFADASADTQSVSLSYLSIAPTPAVEYRYKCTCSSASGTITPQGNSTVTNASHTKSQLMVELIQTGG